MRPARALRVHDAELLALAHTIALELLHAALQLLHLRATQNRPLLSFTCCSVTRACVRERSGPVRSGGEQTRGIIRSGDTPGRSVAARAPPARRPPVSCFRGARAATSAPRPLRLAFGSPRCPPPPTVRLRQSTDSERLCTHTIAMSSSGTSTFDHM